MINEQGHIVLDADGGRVLKTIKDIDKEARALKATLRNLEINSDSYKKTAENLRELNQQQTKLREQLSGTNKMWENIKSQIISVGAVAASFIGFQMITSQIGGMIRKNAELSDSLADIRRKTGMTQEEVEALNGALGKINTRTATKELRSIATELGSLGIAKEAIGSTTEAVDKLAVALQGEFENAAEVTRVTGTLRNVLSDIKSDRPDQDMLHLGNALLELGNAGLATAPVVSDIATRIGSVGISMGLTSGQVLGISASLQELGLTAERGGTATAKILQKMTTNVAGFAQIAGVPMQQFAHMLNTDLYGAFKAVMEGSQKSAESATALGQMLKDAELSGAGASEVFLKLGKNAALMDEKVKLSSQALNETGKIMESFALKNETFGAKLEKLGKLIYGFLANNAITSGFEKIVDGILGIADSSTKADKAVEAFNKTADEYKRTSEKMNPLLQRYDELKTKTNLNAKEQEELKKIIQEISKAMPDAIQQWDELGGAMAIDTAKARELLDHMRRVKEIMNDKAIQEKQKEMLDLQVKQMEVGRQIQQQKENLLMMEKEADKLRGTKFYKDELAHLTAQREQIQKLNTDWYALGDKVKSYGEAIKELKGESIAPPPSSGGTKPADKASPTLSGVLPTADDIEKAKKALEDYIRDTEKLMAQLRSAQAASVTDEVQREVQLAKTRYENDAAGLQQYEQTIIAKRKAGQQLTEEEKQREQVLIALKLQLLEEYQVKAKSIIDKAIEKRSADEFKATLETLDKIHTERTTEIKRQYAIGLLDEQAYNEAIFKENTQHLQNRKTAYLDYGKDIVDIDAAITDAQLAHMKQLTDAEKKAHEESKARKLEGEELNRALASASIDLYTSGVDYMRAIDQGVIQEKERTANAQLAAEKAKSQQRINVIEQEYKSGFLTKEQYDNAKAVAEQNLADRTAAINAELDATKRKMQREEAKRERDLAIFKATVYGIEEVVKNIGNPVLAAIIGAAAAIQIAALAATPLPELAKGGKSTVRGESGQTYNADYVGSYSGGGTYAQPSYGIIGEKGPEWVMPNWMYRDPKMANVVATLEAIRMQGFAAGGSTSTTATSTGYSSPTRTDDNNAAMLALMEKILYRLDNPVPSKLSYDELSYDLNRIGNALDTGKLKS